MAIRKRPFGYEMCRGQIQSCPAEAEVVRMLHEQYANGLSYYDSAQRLRHPGR